MKSSTTKKYLILCIVFLAVFKTSEAQEIRHTQLNPIQIPIVNLPGGVFKMGATGKAVGEPGELPVRDVTVEPFALGLYEVTQAQFEAIMGYNTSYHRGPNNPVEEVSWYDAVRFCNRLSLLNGLDPAYAIDPVEGYTRIPGRNGYRLPTEAEWEYAARAGTTTDTYAGDLMVTEGQDATLDQIAWYYIDGIEGYTREVGGKEPNSYGFFDIIGNVFEWTDSWYGDYDDPSPQAALKVLRGGAMDSAPFASRASYRYRLHPSYTSYNIGFRIARSLDE